MEDAGFAERIPPRFEEEEEKEEEEEEEEEEEGRGCRDFRAVVDESSGLWISGVGIKG